jgi:hypothetical protein
LDCKRLPYPHYKPHPGSRIDLQENHNHNLHLNGTKLKPPQISKSISVSFEEAKSIFFDEFGVQFFDDEHSADEAGVPYQSLINLYLRDCLANSRKVQINWPQVV